MTGTRGIVAAGHPDTAEAGAEVLRAGGNAVDAAIGAMLCACAAEPLLTGLGAGGYMLVVAPGREPVLLDFMVAAPGLGGVPDGEPRLTPIEVNFGDAVQVFHVGAASVGVYGTPAGVEAAAQRFGTLPLADLAASGAALARRGVVLTASQAYVFELLQGILSSTPVCAARFLSHGRLREIGERLPLPELAESIERLGSDGAAPFYEGDIAAAACELVAEGGGALSAEDLRAYAALERAPVTVSFAGAEVLTNPPPSAGGVLIAYALRALEFAGGAEASPVTRVVDAIAAAQRVRTGDFCERLAEPGFADAFLATEIPDHRIGSTTHISVLDADGMACSVTSTNGESSGLVVPGAGILLNNMMGEEDLNPGGFFRHPPARRLPSMMAPTVVRRDGDVELVLGSAGSNRIRSAILQVVLAVCERGDEVLRAVQAPRLHVEDGIVYAEPGVDDAALEAAGHAVVRFRDRNLFFGGVQAVRRDPVSGLLSGAGDPRRGGAVAAA